MIDQINLVQYLCRDHLLSTPGGFPITAGTGGATAPWFATLHPTATAVNEKGKYTKLRDEMSFARRLSLAV